MFWRSWSEAEEAVRRGLHPARLAAISRFIISITGVEIINLRSHGLHEKPYHGSHGYLMFIKRALKLALRV